MTEQARAEEHLRVIRGLMEKATIYRAISAPTALVGGLASVIAAGSLFAQPPASKVRYSIFLSTWMAILLVTGIANALFIWRGAAARNEPFCSSGMKLALKAILPGVLTGAVITAIASADESAVMALPMLWTICYGLALLATANFAPRSIVILGWAFLSAGLLALLCEGFSPPYLSFETIKCASMGMALTFGLFHLIYAACTWPRKGQ